MLDLSLEQLDFSSKTNAFMEPYLGLDFSMRIRYCVTICDVRNRGLFCGVTPRMHCGVCRNSES